MTDMKQEHRIQRLSKKEAWLIGGAGTLCLLLSGAALCPGCAFVFSIGALLCAFLLFGFGGRRAKVYAVLLAILSAWAIGGALHWKKDFEKMKRKAEAIRRMSERQTKTIKTNSMDKAK